MHFLVVNRFFGCAAPTGRLLEDVSRELLARGHEVTVAASATGYVRNGAAGAAPSAAPDSRPLTPDSRLSFLPVWQWPGGPRLVNWGWFWLAALARLLFCRYDACLLLTDPPFLPLAARLAGLVRGRKKVCWWSMDLYPEALLAAGMFKETSLPYRLLRRLNAFGLRGVAGAICLGPRQLERVRQYQSFTARTTVVPPWDLRLMARIPREQNRVVARFGWQGKKVALYGGNLGEGHLFDDFLAAARLFAESGKADWIFAFSAHGSGRAALSQAAAGMANVQVLDYLPEADVPHLLAAADVHLISMKPGWDGVIVPSKLASVLPTGAPVLFIGPPEADTAAEIRRLDCGLCLAPGAGGEAVAAALRRLAERPRRNHEPDTTGPSNVVSFITGAHGG